MTTSAAENLAGRAGEKDKEKVEKRRALGRGLESLLPGPRVVTGGQGGAAGKTQVPHFVRNDKASAGDGQIRGEAVPGTIRAVVEEGVIEEESRAGVPAPHGSASHGACATLV